MPSASPAIATIDDIRAARGRLGDLVVETPVWQSPANAIMAHLSSGTELFCKLELLQYGGSFKPRGALTVMFNLSPEALQRGVTAVSAGNHAIAVAYAARVLGTSAKVVMMKSASPVRVQRCRDFGAEVVLAEDVHAAFDTVHRIEKEEGRSFVHPFEGPYTALGTATLGLEVCQQVRNLDAVIVPIGGGGLCAGVAMAVKQAQPQCQVFGVEPVGADTMSRSFRAGKPEAIDKVRTIADSLGAPHAAPYSFALCRRFVDELVLVDDDMLCQAMALQFSELKLATEPAGAAALAALLHPLRDRLAGQRVATIVCGSNIDLATFSQHVARGQTV